MRRLITLVGALLAMLPASGKGSDSVAISKLNSKAYHYFLSKPDSAIDLANKAIAVAQDKYMFQTGFSYFVLSKANWTKANYFLSILYGFKALKVYENTSHIFHWGETNLSIARTFTDLKNFEQAKIYIDKTYALAIHHKNNRLLAEVFREKSFLFQVEQQYDSALYYSEEGVRLYSQQNDTLNISILYGRISRIYLITGKYQKSLWYCKKAIAMDLLAGNGRGLSIAYGIAGEIFYSLGNKDSSVYFVKKSITIENEIRNIPNIIRMHQLMAKIHEERGEQNAAIENLELINQLKDSLYNQSGNAQIQDILTRYELESKERIIQLLENEKAFQQQKTKNQNLIIGFFGVAIVLLGALALVLWRMRQLQANANRELALRNQDIALQNEEIQSQAESLQEVSRLKSRLLSVISHDLRGPVSNLQSLLDLLTQQLITPEKFKELTNKLKSHLNVSQRALQNLLSWSLSQMEGIRTVPVVFNINQIVADVIELHLEIANKKNIKIDFTQNDELLVKADIEQVNLILRNLTHNAVKFSKQNGVVKIKAEKQNQYCVLTVEDTGVGMTKSEVSTVLTENEFFTRTGTNQEKGTGLGLLLCKDFIKRNNGTLRIESSPEKGAIIEFTLPLA